MSVEAPQDQLTLEEKAARTCRSFTGISPSHGWTGPMAATWPERHGGTE